MGKDARKQVASMAASQANAVRDAAAVHAKVVAGDLWHAVRTQRTAQILLLILVVSLVGWEAPVISQILYPFKLFVTVVHEACHALVARLTGGNVGVIAISPDESGVTLSMGGIRHLTSMAGYLGTSIFGGLLIWWGRKPTEARFILQSIGSVIIALTVFYGGGGLFSVIAMALIGVAILFVARKANDGLCHLFLLMLAVMTTLEAVISIQELFLISALTGRESDAKTMETLTGIPAVAWSILWGLISMIILVFAFWISYRPDRNSAKPAKASNDTNTSAAEPAAGIGMDSPSLDEEEQTIKNPQADKQTSKRTPW